MRIETVRAWMFVGFCLLTIGTLLYIFDVTDDPAIFLAAVGFVYFIVGVVSTLMHDRHMLKRTRAGRE
jgi:hypothetical protein